MKKVLVKKTFRYDPTFNGKYSRYRGYSLITLQKKSPGIKEQIPVKVLERIKNPIYCSSLRRGRETALVFKEKLKIKQVETLPQLNEVLFDLKKLVTRNEFEKFGSNLVRKRFIEAFINDNLAEPRKLIEKRIEELFTQLNCLPDGSYLLVSHSFLMKVLQIYIRDKRLFKKPKILPKHFDFTKKTFEFGRGFVFYL